MKALSHEAREHLSTWQTAATQTGRKDDKDAAAHNKRAEPLQDELISSVKGGRLALASYMRRKLGLSDGKEIDAPDLPRVLSPSEYRDPPLALERELCDSLPDLTPARAAQPAFWALCHIAWLEAGCFESPLEVFFLGAKVTGKEVGKPDQAVRNLFRRMSGLPHARGKVSVLADCTISCAWWRGRVARLAADESVMVNDPFSTEDAHRVLHAGNDAWARLVGDSVRRVTVVNHSRLHAALIAEYLDAARDKGGLPAKEVQSVVRELATLGTTLCFDMMPWAEIRAIVEQAVARARAART